MSNHRSRYVAQNQYSGLTPPLFAKTQTKHNSAMPEASVNALFNVNPAGAVDSSKPREVGIPSCEVNVFRSISKGKSAGPICEKPVCQCLANLSGATSSFAGHPGFGFQLNRHISASCAKIALSLGCADKMGLAITHGVSKNWLSRD